MVKPAVAARLREGVVASLVPIGKGRERLVAIDIIFGGMPPWDGRVKAESAS
jgi:hypothetical protein